MGFWAGLLIGTSVGGTLGVVLAGLLYAAKRRDGKAQQERTDVRRIEMATVPGRWSDVRRN